MLPKGLQSVIIHCSVWVILLAIMHAYGSMVGREFNLLIIVPNLAYISLFYFNYSLLIEKLLFRRKITAYILVNIVVFTLMFYAMHELGELMDSYVQKEYDFEPKREPLRHSIVGYIFFSILVVAPALSIKMTRKWLDAQQKIRESERMRVEMELASLKNQLNPHFLFNSLNNIYALISFNPSVAQSSLLSVCDLLRYQLYDSDYKVVELEKEVRFIGSYCDLMCLRFGDGVKVTVDLPKNTAGIKVAPLLFISLVENAFKHGVDSQEECYINIRMSIMEGQILFVCSNSNHPKSAQDRSGSGIGLANLVRRLDLIYPHGYSYDVNRTDNDYIVTLIINTQQND